MLHLDIITFRRNLVKADPHFLLFQHSSHGTRHFSTGISKISALNVESVIASYKNPLTI